jgi:predicted AlkP superfamily pyrophosphatase or phosphodiesterase
MKKLLTAIAFLSVFTAHSQQHPIKHVIVLGIDGCSPDGIIQAPTPNIDSLIAHGSWTFEAKAQKPTVSSPNWASIIDGVPPAEHGIWSNAWKRKDIRDSVYCHGRKGRVFPTIFRVLRESDKKAQICCLMEWWSFRRLVEPGVCSLRQRTVLEGITDMRAPTVISVRKPKFLFFHFNNVDETGHKYGHGTPEYYAAVARVDKSIGKIIKAVRKAGMLESTVFVIIADHGGIGHGHGGNTPQETNVPFIISGAGIKQNHQIKAYVNNYDCSPTIAKMLGAKVPDCWQGKVVEEIFE